MGFVLLLGQDVAEDVKAPLSPLGVVFTFLAALWEGNGEEGEMERRGKGEERRGGGESRREGKKGIFWVSLGVFRHTILIADLFLLS